MAYFLKTGWPHVFAHHAEWCRARDGQPCTCGPLGYRTVVEDPETGRRIPSPLLASATEAYTWHREQLAAMQTSPTPLRADAEPQPDTVASQPALERPASTTDTVALPDGGLVAEATSLPDAAIWWSLRVVVLVFILVILVLIAESV
jgi:hypothetical protein